MYSVFVLNLLSLSLFTLYSVVQVFNAVNQQQKGLEQKLQKVGSSERKRSKGMQDYIQRMRLGGAKEVSKIVRVGSDVVCL